ncbi:MAG: hypothetical protein IJG08_03670 [Oscillospiraceae bacterium]|nr:hypothetical protein [Oscillospiraceae bacterium]MBR7055712.1 hypothetical protein [Oscillospiraceae bacterium]
MKAWKLDELKGALRNSRYVLLVLALGLLLLLLPRSANSASAKAAAGAGDPLEASGIPLETECARLGELLEAIRGVGAARVLLSRSGAVVVCDGASDAQVRLDVTEAVSAYTGLGSDKIRVMQRSFANH